MVLSHEKLKKSILDKSLKITDLRLEPITAPGGQWVNKMTPGCCGLILAHIGLDHKNANFIPIL